MDFEQDEYLLDEVVNEVERLDTLKAGSEDHSRATSDAVALHKQLLEEWKFAAATEQEARALDQADAKIALEREKLEFEKAQATEQKRFRIGETILKGLVDVAAIGVPALIYNTWMNKGFEFEQNGTFTSQTFRSLFNKFTPKRR